MSSVTEAIVFELTLHDAINILELFVQTIAVLQVNPYLDSGLMAWLFVPLRLRCLHLRLLVITAAEI